MNLIKEINENFQKKLKGLKKSGYVFLPCSSENHYVMISKVNEQMIKQIKKASRLSEDFSSIHLQNTGEKIIIDCSDEALFVKAYPGKTETIRIQRQTKTRMMVDSYNSAYASKIEFAFFKDGHVMQKRGKNYFPATLKSLLKIHSLLFETWLMSYFEVMSTDFPIFLDFLREFQKQDFSLSVPIPLNKVIDNKLYSYQSIFQSCYKLSFHVPKKVNQMSLREAYWKIKACKYVTENEIQKIMTLNLKEVNSSFIFYVQDVFQAYYEDKLKLKDSEILRDFIRMSMKVNGKVSLSIRSNRGLCDRHDDLIVPYLKKVAPNKKMVIPKTSPFRKLKLPAHIKMIKTGAKLYQESEAMHHCVYSYLEAVNKGKCVILHIDYDKQPYTAEIRIRKNKFTCVQLQGKFNAVAPKELKTFIFDVLEKNQNYCPLKSNIIDGGKYEQKKEEEALLDRTCFNFACFFIPGIRPFLLKQNTSQRTN